MRCRPGDLALVIRDDRMPDNVGRFVIVERVAVPNEVLHVLREGDRRINLRTSPENDWIVRPAGGGTLLATTSIRKWLVQLPTVPFKDSWLWPIRPGELDDETENVQDLAHEA